MRGISKKISFFWSLDTWPQQNLRFQICVDLYFDPYTSLSELKIVITLDQIQSLDKKKR